MQDTFSSSVKIPWISTAIDFILYVVRCSFYLDIATDTQLVIQRISHNNKRPVNKMHNSILHRNICFDNPSLHSSSFMLLSSSHCFGFHNWALNLKFRLWSENADSIMLLTIIFCANFSLDFKVWDSSCIIILNCWKQLWSSFWRKCKEKLLWNHMSPHNIFIYEFNPQILYFND